VLVSVRVTSRPSADVAVKFIVSLTVLVISEVPGV
jgi:hypothetical protein